MMRQGKLKDSPKAVPGAEAIPESILDYWFEGLSEKSPLEADSAVARRWFGKDESTDREIRERFEEHLERAVRGEYRHWANSSDGSLALVILTDQFPRNMYRGTPKAFATDPLALETSLQAIRGGQDHALSLMERMFLYMPLMHAESVEVQRQSRGLFESLARLARIDRSPFTSFLAMSADYAERHAAIVERFHRFPHRNAILGRPSTPEEIAFLREPGSSF
ncbi:MAG: DUF924 family protein [bacterium]